MKCNSHTNESDDDHRLEFRSRSHHGKGCARGLLDDEVGLVAVGGVVKEGQHAHANAEHRDVVYTVCYSKQNTIVYVVHGDIFSSTPVLDVKRLCHQGENAGGKTKPPKQQRTLHRTRMSHIFQPRGNDTNTDKDQTLA